MLNRVLTIKAREQIIAHWSAAGGTDTRSRPVALSFRHVIHFHTDLSASQRWPLNSLASASTEPLSSFGSPPSSSPVDSSDRFSFAPGPSSAVVITGLEIHSISRSDAPGLSDETSAVTSILSVSASGG